MSKGSIFERAICKQLSLWWTDGKDDAVFWRSSNSGGRAKVRSYKNKATFGQYGDIQATNPIGQPLIDLCAIELKRGYRGASLGDMLDVLPHAAKQNWECWLDQVLLDKANSERPYWMLITKRDMRDVMICMPHGLYKRLNLCGASLSECASYGLFVPFTKDPNSRRSVYTTSFSQFLVCCDPLNVIALAKEASDART